MPASSRLQQHATRAAFFMPGFAIAAWAPMVPFAKVRAGLDDATLGLVLLCLGAGSLLAMPLAGALAARQGCRRVMVVAMLLIAALLPLLVLAVSPPALGAVLFVLGAAMGTMDCTMNLQAVVVERESRRPLMSGFHGFYSIGGFAGAAVLTALLSAGASPLAAVLVAVAVLALLLLLAAPYWRGERIGHNGPVFAWPRGSVVLIGAICFVVFLAEGAMLDWGAVLLYEVKGVASARAGAGYVVFALAMTLTRLIGDWLVQRIGRLPVVVGGAVLAFAGFLVLTLVPSPGLALAGFAMVGVGCANIVPVMFTLAGNQAAMPERQAIPAVTTLGYAGVLAGPALIGFVADATSLVAALLAVAVALLAVAINGWWLART